MDKPQIIVIDGPDGVGKTTQVHLLAAALAEQGVSPYVTRASGGTPIGEELRKASLSLHPRRPETDVYISLAMHTELGHDLLARRQRGQTIIVDRSPLAILAYNLHGAGLQNRALADDACKTLLNLWSVDVFIYMDAPQTLLNERRQMRGNTDFFESQDGEFHQRVRTGYKEGLALLKTNKNYAGIILEVDGSETKHLVHQQILETVAR